MCLVRRETSETYVVRGHNKDGGLFQLKLTRIPSSLGHERVPNTHIQQCPSDDVSHGQANL